MKIIPESEIFTYMLIETMIDTLKKNEVMSESVKHKIRKLESIRKDWIESKINFLLED